MKYQLESKVWPNRSQPTTRNGTMIYPDFNTGPSKTLHRSGPISVQRVNPETKVQSQDYDEYFVADKEKQAQTGRWVLNVIAANEAYRKLHMSNKKGNVRHTDSKRSSKLSSQYIDSRLHRIEKKHSKNQNRNRLPNETIINPVQIHNDQTTSLSRFSSATPIYDIETIERSVISSLPRSSNQSRDYSIDEFNEIDENTCLSKRMLIIITIISIIFIIGIFVAVLVTIFVGRSGSTDSSGKILDFKSILTPLSSENYWIYPIEMFNITDPLCEGQISYNYYSCYQMATSKLFTIQFALQHDTISGHWYFDGISVVQNDNIQLIVNGGFESNLTGWTLNISSNSTPDTYIDTTTNLAHTGSAYLYGASKYYPVYIQQTFQVIQGEYINVSFWWKYDGGLKLGHICQAIGRLIPSL
ncbi:unnamed protein product [Rotaria sordida]|uniref:Uncharacterized protein n=1 Tax=Rotaria sordida TaxID=392033 RepID=A0A818SQI1_9BILA|nr:unnamed protein product [Rotaria sordida]